MEAFLLLALSEASAEALRAVPQAAASGITSAGSSCLRALTTKTATRNAAAKSTAPQKNATW